MTDEQMQNLLTSIIEMKNHLERMSEKQEEMHNDVKKINKARSWRTIAGAEELIQS